MISAVSYSARFQLIQLSECKRNLSYVDSYQQLYDDHERAQD